MRPANKDLRRLGISFVTEEAGIREYVLKSNSLKILLACTNALSAALVQHVYVGSRHEGSGRTGYAHLLEHMAFKGTDAHNKALGNSYDEFVKAHGNEMNATTWFDATKYFAKVPVHALRELIAHEADRLRNAHITDDELKNEMPVVVKEFELDENKPSSLLTKLIWSLAFTEHPYKVDTIGSRSEVMKVTAQALKDQFYDRFYWPNNIALIIAGGIDELQTLAWIAESYGKIPPSPQPIPQVYTVEPQQFGERRGVIHRPGDLANVGLAFHIPGSDHDDHWAIDVLSTVLGSGPSSRLYRKLVDKGLAAGAGAYNIDTHDPGLFEIRVVVAPGVKPERIEKLVLKEIEKLQSKPISVRELNRIKSQFRTASQMQRKETLGLAHTISNYEDSVDWLWGVRASAECDKLTPADVQRVANKYLVADNRIVGYFIPTGEKQASDQEEEKHDKPVVVDDTITSPTFEKTVTYPLPEDNTGTPLAKQVQTVTLANGLTLQMLPTTAEAPLGFSLMVNAGLNRSSGNRMLPGLTGELLTRGSAKFTKRRLTEIVSESQVDFDWSIDIDQAILETTVTAEHLPTWLDMVSDSLLQPKLAAEELELLKTQAAATLEQMAVDPQTQAWINFTQALYGAESPWRLDDVAMRQAQLSQVTHDDVVAFHKQFGPKGSVMSVVGKFDPAEMQRTIEAKLGNWQGGETPVHELPGSSISASNAGLRKSVFIPGKDAISILVGSTMPVSKRSPDYLATLLANNALGLDTMASRLGYEIREKRGLTYGVVSQLRNANYNGAPWSVRMSTDAQKLERSLSLIDKIVRCYVKDGIGDKELYLEKCTLLNSQALSMDAAVQVAHAICEAQYMGFGIDRLDTLVADVKAVTREQVNEAIRKYFLMDNTVTVVAGTLPEGK
jgi:zinc protease